MKIMIGEVSYAQYVKHAVHPDAASSVGLAARTVFLDPVLDKLSCRNNFGGATS